MNQADMTMLTGSILAKGGGGHGIRLAALVIVIIVVVLVLGRIAYKRRAKRRQP